MSIYIIRSKDLSLHDCYIGGTENMRDRMYQHKTNCNNENRHHYNYKVYQHIRKHGGWDNWEMVEIACVWKNATKPLFEIEQDYIDMWKSTLNCKRAYQTKQQRKEQKKKCDRQYRENNKEYYKEYQREYRENNRDILSEKDREYYQNNKDIISEKKKEKFDCECGSTVRKSDKARHLKTNKHQNYIQSLSLPSLS